MEILKNFTDDTFELIASGENYVLPNQLNNNDVMMINRNQKTKFDETDFYTLLGIKLEDEELVDELKFKVTINYK